ARGRGAPRPLPTDALPSGTPDPGGGRQGAPDEGGRGMSVPRSHGSPEPWGYGAPEPGTHGAPEPGAYGSPASQARPSPDPTLHSAPTGAAAHHLPEPRLAPPAPAVPAPTPADRKSVVEGKTASLGGRTAVRNATSCQNGEW